MPLWRTADHSKDHSKDRNMEHCRYHSRQGASWHCPGCQTHFCNTCIPGGEENFRAGQPRCPLCSTSLAYLGEGRKPEPFWRMGPRFFAYGLHPRVLLFGLLAGWAGAWQGGLASGVLSLFLYGLLLCYGLLIVSAVAAGDWEPPSMAEAMDHGNLFVRQIAVLVLMFVVPLFVLTQVLWLGLGLLVLTTVALPASVMLLALSRSVTVALNPLLWLKLMFTIGWPYLLLWLALLTVNSAPQVVGSLFAGALGNAVVQVLLGALAVYASVVAYAMMGYVLHERGDRLGLSATQARGKSLAPDEYERREALGLSHIYAREGRLDDARQRLEAVLNQQPNDRGLHDQLHRVLRLLKKDKALALHTERYCRLLVAQGYGGSAAGVVRATRQELKGFRPEDPALCHQLAEQLAEQGHWRDAAQLLVNMHQRAPDYRGLGDAYVLLARVYLEGDDRLPQAQQLMQFVATRFPDSHASEAGRQVQDLLARTVNIQALSAGDASAGDVPDDTSPASC
ncbi:tetratricopeptide repeat protein [Alcanivorax sp. JB21]|uniref:tetratricopeptide repeat protein n=1 Tax=Alcanivorax limicola TaxID=2874102 RepID=UPI001CC0BD7B|nr:tetratricopeptide repeat protein [Alcanivorax limicola]MBZ2188326.1 tetratricopeptide repeat protein [Alcanivorax limicola]